MSASNQSTGFYCDREFRERLGVTASATQPEAWGKIKDTRYRHPDLYYGMMGGLGNPTTSFSSNGTDIGAFSIEAMAGGATPLCASMTSRTESS